MMPKHERDILGKVVYEFWREWTLKQENPNRFDNKLDYDQMNERDREISNSLAEMYLHAINKYYEGLGKRIEQSKMGEDIWSKIQLIEDTPPLDPLL